MSSGASLLQAAEQALGERALRDREAHLKPEEVIAYYEGELAAEDEERVQDHLALCQECADLALDYQAFPEIEPASEDLRASPAEAEADWQAVRSRLFNRRSSFWISQALAASFFVTTLGAASLAAYYRTKLSEASQPRFITVVSDLTPEEDPVLQDESEAVTTVPRRASNLMVVLHPPVLPSEADYLVEILESPSPDAEVLWSKRGLEPTAAGYFVLEMNRDFLPGGAYRVRLSTLEGEREHAIAHYTLRLEYE